MNDNTTKYYQPEKEWKKFSLLVLLGFSGTSQCHIKDKTDSNIKFGRRRVDYFSVVGFFIFCCEATSTNYSVRPYFLYDSQLSERRLLLDELVKFIFSSHLKINILFLLAPIEFSSGMVIKMKSYMIYHQLVKKNYFYQIISSHSYVNLGIWLSRVASLRSATFSPSWTAKLYR